MPWVNVDQLVVRFDRPVEPLASHFTARGERAGAYEVTAAQPLAGVPNAYLVSLDSSLGRDGSPAANGDRVTLALDGGSGGLRSAGGVLLDGDGDGTPGGNFQYELRVLQGDVDRSGSVLANDFSEVKQKFFSTAASPGSGDSAFHDVDGSGNILAVDFSAVKKRYFSQLLPAPTASELFSPARALDSRRIIARILAVGMG